MIRREEGYVGKRVRRMVIRRRKRGRPKRRWGDGIREDMEAAGGTEEEALDRGKWRGGSAPATPVELGKVKPAEEDLINVFFAFLIIHPSRPFMVSILVNW